MRCVCERCWRGHPSGRAFLAASSLWQRRMSGEEGGGGQRNAGERLRATPSTHTVHDACVQTRKHARTHTHTHTHTHTCADPLTIRPRFFVSGNHENFAAEPFLGSALPINLHPAWHASRLLGIVHGTPGLQSLGAPGAARQVGVGRRTHQHGIQVRARRVYPATSWVFTVRSGAICQVPVVVPNRFVTRLPV